MLTVARAQELYVRWFARWVQDLRLEFVEVDAGRAVARLPANDAITRGPEDIVSGQAIMSAIDTVMVLATISALGEEIPTTTVSQTTNFLRPLPNTDAVIDVVVVRAGKTMAFGTASVYPAEAPDRIAATATITYAILRGPSS